MAEYIEREAALKRLQMQLLNLEIDQDKGDYSELCENRGARDALDEAIYDIRTLKAADVQPAKRGKWLIKENHFHSCGIMLYAECSCCGHTCSTTESEHNNYCPNCGADIRGDENDL